MNASVSLVRMQYELDALLEASASASRAAQSSHADDSSGGSGSGSSGAAQEHCAGELVLLVAAHLHNNQLREVAQVVATRLDLKVLAASIYTFYNDHVTFVFTILVRTRIKSRPSNRSSLNVYKMPIRTTTLSRMRQMMTSALNEANLLEYMLRLSCCTGGSGSGVGTASADSPTSASALGALDSRGARSATRRAPLLPVGCVYQLLSARSGSGSGAGSGSSVSVSSSSALVSRSSSMAMTPSTPSAAAAASSSPFEDPFGFAFGSAASLDPFPSGAGPSAPTPTPTPTRIPLRDWLLRYMLDASLERLDPQLPALIEAFTRLSVSAPLGAAGSNEATPLKTLSTPSNRFGICFTYIDNYS